MSESNDDVESVFKNLSNLERPWRLSLFSFFEATLLPYLVPLSLSLSLSFAPHKNLKRQRGTRRRR